MKMTWRIASVAAASTAMLATYAIAPASAINNIKGFGVQETLKNFVSLGDFNSEIGYTVKDLRPSSDPVPYPVAGRLYEANATTTAVVGTVFPQVGNFIARSPGGVDYRVLPVSTLSGAPLGPGGTAAGKLYFDVVGENPDSVVFNSNFEDLLGWVGPIPITPGDVVPGTSSGNEAAGSGAGGGSTGGSSTNIGGDGSTESGGGNLATPPSVGDGAQNGSYGPAGNTPPVGGNGSGGR